MLVFDEVMTGFRIAKGCAQEHFGVTPDLTTMGKVIGGGLPVGAYGGKRKIMEMVAPAGPMYQVRAVQGRAGQGSAVQCSVCDGGGSGAGRQGGMHAAGVAAAACSALQSSHSGAAGCGCIPPAGPASDVLPPPPIPRLPPSPPTFQPLVTKHDLTVYTNNLEEGKELAK